MLGRKIAAKVPVLLTILTSACSASARGTGDVATFTPQQVVGRRLFGHRCTSRHATKQEMVVAGLSHARIHGTAGARAPGMDAETYKESSVGKPATFVVDRVENQMPTSQCETPTQEEIDAFVAHLLSLD